MFLVEDPEGEILGERKGILEGTGESSGTLEGDEEGTTATGDP